MSRVIRGINDHIVKGALEFGGRLQFTCRDLMMSCREVEQFHYACWINLLLTPMARPLWMFMVIEVNNSESNCFWRKSSASELLHSSRHYVASELFQSVCFRIGR